MHHSGYKLNACIPLNSAGAYTMLMTIVDDNVRAYKQDYVDVDCHEADGARRDSPGHVRKVDCSSIHRSGSWLKDICICLPLFISFWCVCDSIIFPVCVPSFSFSFPSFILSTYLIDRLNKRSLTHSLTHSLTLTH